jgi:hypothetical protein
MMLHLISYPHARHGCRDLVNVAARRVDCREGIVVEQILVIAVGMAVEELLLLLPLVDRDARLRRQAGAWFCRYPGEAGVESELTSLASLARLDGLVDAFLAVLNTPGALRARLVTLLLLLAMSVIHIHEGEAPRPVLSTFSLL